MKVKALLDSACTALIEAHKAEHQVDAIWLLSAVTGLSRTMLELEGDREVLPEEAAQFEGYLAQRLDGRPLQYILGVQSFYGHEFQVKEGVLIPRFETEELVERALHWAKAHKATTLMDMCTGSGCIGLTVLKECPEMTGVLVDYSDTALDVARKNRAALGLENRATLYHSDLFSDVPEMTVDMLLSNPPYIASATLSTLEEEVRGAEPSMALDGGGDGLDFYRAIGAQGKHYLRKGGLLLVEIGYDQRQSVMAIFEQEGYTMIEGIRDLSGRDRMVLCVR